MKIALEDVVFSEAIFDRPESVVCTRRGDIYASHRTAMAIRVSSSGKRKLLGVRRPAVTEFLPNGIALRADGSLLVANMAGEGGVWLVGADGEVTSYLTEVDGVPITAANFVMLDQRGRTWITCSTRCADRSDPFNRNVSDGYIVLSDDRGARIVADGLAFANECRLNQDENALVICETAGARVSRFAVGPGGSLGLRQTWAEFDDGAYPDGCTFDSEDHLWVACPVGNRLFRVAPSGESEMVLEDAMPGQVEKVTQARASGRFGREHFYSQFGSRLQAITSVAFGGPDLRTVFLGSLLDSRLAHFRAPVAGYGWSG